MSNLAIGSSSQPPPSVPVPSSRATPLPDGKDEGVAIRKDVSASAVMPERVDQLSSEKLEANGDSNKVASAEELRDAVGTLQKAVAPLAQELTFSVDQDTGRTVIKVTDRATDTVVRQIPSKEALEMARYLQEAEKSQGLLLNQKV